MPWSLCSAQMPLAATKGRPPPQPAGPTLSGNAPDAVNKQAYRYAYTMKPGATPIVAVRVVSGALPEGLSLDTKGVLSGTVEVAGLVAGAKRAYPFTIRVTDANGLWACVSDTMTITTAEVICGTSTSYSGGKRSRTSCMCSLEAKRGCDARLRHRLQP
ncbi:Ig domain-containing protein [Xylella fastidiosa]|uniref:Ig domain-containing protein n=1 Tax=Xylella fastidiosa TaxID=2371 RepID=UPI003984CD14